ncbi:hypothetical protein NLN92_19460 [Citrobacter portucalensis]|uniref:hypothetical protein n=1 Tax=Citrobacter portucalensis TaxID=1639133 RepID=UPI00226B1A38|nr:hypothetical protein [Citrobacter portucalensis]MCX8980187.1 hypothetical protein [Citrobacter portucalensis]
MLNVCGAIMPDNISPYLKVYITDSQNGDLVVGYIGDGASASLSSEWTAPFAGVDLGSLAGQQLANGVAGGAQALGNKAGGTLGNVISKGGQMLSGGLSGLAGNLGNIASLFGSAMAATINSAMVWQGQQPPQFTMPIYLLAHADPYKEVQLPIRVLEQMASPQLNAALPGGRVPSKVTLDIGRRIKLTNVIIQEVTYELDAPRDGNGYFLQNNVSLQMCGDTAYNRTDFDGMFI